MPLKHLTWHRRNLVWQGPLWTPHCPRTNPQPQVVQKWSWGSYICYKGTGSLQGGLPSSNFSLAIALIAWFSTNPSCSPGVEEFMSRGILISFPNLTCIFIRWVRNRDVSSILHIQIFQSFPQRVHIWHCDGNMRTNQIIVWVNCRSSFNQM